MFGFSRASNLINEKSDTYTQKTYHAHIHLHIFILELCQSSFALFTFQNNPCVYYPGPCGSTWKLFLLSALDKQNLKSRWARLLCLRWPRKDVPFFLTELRINNLKKELSKTEHLEQSESWTYASQGFLGHTLTSFKILAMFKMGTDHCNKFISDRK